MVLYAGIFVNLRSWRLSVESLEEFFDLLRDAEDDEALLLLRTNKLVKKMARGAVGGK